MGNKALVLGGHGDIGSAIAVSLTRDGFAVRAVGRRDFDLARPDEIDAFIGRESAEWDVVVHAAGYNKPCEFSKLEDAEIRYSLEANLHGFLRIASACTPYWQSRRSGKIVVISSLYGHLARSGRLPYVMAKHALIGAVQTLAIELGRNGVLVNAVSPGFIDTQMTRKNNSPERISRLASGIPLGRLGQPEDVAEAVSFLCSPNNRYLNGHDLVLDGGFSAGGFQDMTS